MEYYNVEMIVEKKLLNGIYLSLYNVHSDTHYMVKLHDKDCKFKGAFLNTARVMEIEKATEFYNNSF